MPEEWHNISIKTETFLKIKAYADAQKKTYSNIIEDLLQQPTQNIETPKLEPVCIWDYFYWKPQKDKDGNILRWERVNNCPILNKRPDLWSLSSSAFISTMMKACKMCEVKTKDARRREKALERRETWKISRPNEIFTSRYGYVPADKFLKEYTQREDREEERYKKEAEEFDV